jgi:hypothetical protein
MSDRRPRGRRPSRWCAAGATALLSAACTSALKEPAPLPREGFSAPAASVDDTLSSAEASFALRPDHDAVERAREGFLAAARADESRVEGLLGAMRASAWLIEHEADAARRGQLAGEAVELGQWCTRRAPAEVECGYRLALAIGQQARERPATALDGLKVMVDLLESAAAARPGLDDGGPDRVLALVLLRAPGWPAGPGDPEIGLERARLAAGRSPDYPPNQLVLGEALRANRRPDEARAAYRFARTVAAQRAAGGDPDAAEWGDEAAKALASF